MTFSARVNFATENYERKNLESMYNPLSYTQSTRASSVSFGYTFPNIGLRLSTSANLSQNMRDSSIVSATLPNFSISLLRFYPFRRKHRRARSVGTRKSRCRTPDRSLTPLRRRKVACSSRTSLRIGAMVCNTASPSTLLSSSLSTSTSRRRSRSATSCMPLA